MRSYTKTIPRSGSVSVDVVPKGSAYGEDVGTTDEITIVARKFGKVIRLAEEDLEDELVDILNEKKTAWGNAYAVTIDNACLATSAAANGTTVPFLSVYQAVRTADAAVGYTANANYVATAGTGATVTYDKLRQLVANFEHRAVLRPGPGARHRAPDVQGPAPRHQGHQGQADLHRPHQPARPTSSATG
jgi:HK97 family phage major capsid protein